MEEFVNETKVEKGISLIDLWIVFKKFWAQIVVVTLILTVAAGVLSYFLVKKSYTASVNIIINPTNVFKENTDNASYARNANEFGLSVYPTIKDILNSKVIDYVNNKKNADSIKENLLENELIEEDGEIYKVSKANLTISKADSSLMFTLSYKTFESAEAAINSVNEIAYSLVEISNERKPNPNIKANGDEDTVFTYPFGGMLNITENNNGATAAVVAKSWKIYPILVFIIAFVLLYVYFLLLSIFDDTVKSKNEIEQITGFNVIAYIEDINEANSKKKSRKNA